MNPAPTPKTRRSLEQLKAARKANRTDLSRGDDRCGHEMTFIQNGVVTCAECGGMRLEEQAR